MTALEVLVEVRRLGADVVFTDGGKLALKKRSAVPDGLAAQVRLRIDDVRALLRERLPATAHRYVVWRGAVDHTRSVCLSCGIPPTLHGTDALNDALILDDANDAPLIEARAIVAAAAAESAQ